VQSVVSNALVVAAAAAGTSTSQLKKPTTLDGREAVAGTQTLLEVRAQQSSRAPSANDLLDVLDGAEGRFFRTFWDRMATLLGIEPEPTFALFPRGDGGPAELLVNSQHAFFQGPDAEHDVRDRDLAGTTLDALTAAVQFAATRAEDALRAFFAHDSELASAHVSALLPALDNVIRGMDPKDGDALLLTRDAFLEALEKAGLAKDRPTNVDDLLAVLDSDAGRLFRQFWDYMTALMGYDPEPHYELVAGEKGSVCVTSQQTFFLGEGADRAVADADLAETSRRQMMETVQDRAACIEAGLRSHFAERPNVASVPVSHLMVWLAEQIKAIDPANTEAVEKLRDHFAQAMDEANFAVR
jgi:hypothetical protein